MNFLSWSFALFAGIVVLLYYSRPFRNFQVLLLVLSSAFFFGCAEWRMLPLLFAAVLGTYGCLVAAMHGRRHWMTAGVVFNLLLLGFFKYKFLFFSSASGINSGFSYLDYLLLLPLPIGISFFIFHNVSLLVDFTKRRETVGKPAFSHVLLYIVFFPQLVSGPITRATGFFPQIEAKLAKDVDWVSAARWLIIGYFMKSFCANNLNPFTSYLDSAAGLATLAGMDRIFLIFLYSIQIYADFFGYSSIAVGLALVFGYRLPLNFRYPYLSSSVHDFWNRWHISLSNWLKTYLYFPLGGNRKGTALTYFNLMTVMSLGGLWHGAGLNYLLWGAFHGFLLCLERPILHHGDRLTRAFGPGMSKVLGVARVMLVFSLVSLGWLLFKFPHVGDVTKFVAGIIQNPWVTFHSNYFYLLALTYSIPVVIQHLCADLAKRRWFSRIEPAFYALLVFLAIVEAGPDSTFIYFQF